MHGEEFKKQMGNLSSYFRVNLNDDQKYQYQKSLSHIPGEAIEEITRVFVEERRPTAGNFPTINEIKYNWYQWLRDHPEKKTIKKIEPCDDCKGTGFISYRRPAPIIHLEVGNDIPMYFHGITETCICASCGNIWRHLGPKTPIEQDRRMTLAQVKEKGFKPWPYREPAKTEIQNKEVLAGMVGEKVNPNIGEYDYSDQKYNQRKEILKQQAGELTANKVEEDEIPF